MFIATLTPDQRLPHHPSVDRRRFLLISLAGAVATPLAVEAQQAKITRLGVLLVGTPDTDAFPSIRRGLDALGYVEGRTILFELHYAEGGPSDSRTSRTISSARSPT